MATRPGSTHAFTLLELLVVVAVIALLLAILLPALSAANEAGRGAVCGTNLNQVFLGSFAYCQANEQRLPWFGGNGPPAGYEWWVTQVARGMETFERGIYACPSDTLPAHVSVYEFNGVLYMGGHGRPKSIPRDVPARLRRMRLKVTYSGSCDLLAQKSRTDTTLTPRKITSWSRPQKAILLLEGIGKATDEPETDHERACYRYLGDLDKLRRGQPKKFVRPSMLHSNYDTWQRHFGSTNVLFVDGHVDTRLPTEIGRMARTQEFHL